MADVEKKVSEKKPAKKDYLLAIGRRRRAVARVRLYKSGSGIITVNSKPAQEYFSTEANKAAYMLPFAVTNTVGKFDVTVKVVGGGAAGQLGAVIHGIARAIESVDSKEYRPALKSKGLLTRDPRVKQRRMVGMGGKSRRRKQSPKR